MKILFIDTTDGTDVNHKTKPKANTEYLLVTITRYIKVELFLRLFYLVKIHIK